MKRKSTPMVLDRKAVLRHLSGHSIRFEPGVPIGVPPMLVKSAIGMGAKVVDGDTPNIFDEEQSKKPMAGPIDPGERLDEIIEVVSKMIERNDRDEWTGTGTPNVNRVAELVGYKVQKEEVVAAFAKAREENPEETVETDER